MRIDVVQQFTKEASLVYSGGRVWLCHNSGHRVDLGRFIQAMGKVRKAIGCGRFHFALFFIMATHFNRSHSLGMVNAVRLLVLDHIHNIEA